MCAMILKNPAKNFEFANFFTKMTACFGNLSVFEQQINEIATVAGIDLSQFEIDHLAVRMNSVEKAEQWRAMLLEQGELLKESEVNGRSIALLTLHQPLIFLNQQVDVIELPFPKGKTYPQEGWEHIEIVVPFLANESIEAWVERLMTQFQLEQNSALKIKVSQPKVEGERLANPSIAISLKDETNQNNCCLKLHPYDIKSVVRSES